VERSGRQHRKRSPVNGRSGSIPGVDRIGQQAAMSGQLKRSTGFSIATN
jgi:hypothetical protein